MKIASTATLEQRIRQIKKEVETLIEARVAALSEQSPGVPRGVIRNLITARAPACACAQYLALLRDEASAPL